MNEGLGELRVSQTLFYCGNQCGISGNLSGTGRWYGITCDLAAQTAYNYITAGRYFLCFCQKRSDGSFVDLVGISNHRAYRMSGGICIVEEDQKKQGRKFKLRRSQLWKRES